MIDDFYWRLTQRPSYEVVDMATLMDQLNALMAAAGKGAVVVVDTVTQVPVILTSDLAAVVGSLAAGVHTAVHGVTGTVLTGEAPTPPPAAPTP